MKTNPIMLTDDELRAIPEQRLQPARKFHRKGHKGTQRKRAIIGGSLCS